MISIIKAKKAEFPSNWRLLIAIIAKLLRFCYIFLINLPFLGKPSQENMAFVCSIYKEAFHRDLRFYYKLFYQLFGKNLIHIYECEGHKAGFALFQIHSLRKIHLFAIALRISFQGKGLAKPFLLRCLSYWRDQGFTTCSLKVESTNRLAQRIYYSLDFRYHKSDKETITMLKAL